MSINCDVILQWSAKPEHLTAVGAALWRWSIRAARSIGIYQFLNNQALADLIAGKLPLSGQTDRRGLHLWVRDEVSSDCQAAIDSLRREIPTRGVVDIVVEGASWRDSANPLRTPCGGPGWPS